MMPMLWKRIAAGLALAAAFSAQAQMGHRHPSPRSAEGERPMRHQIRADIAQREALRQEHGQGARMSPEERRQLRRDIHEAGRELYPRELPQRPQP